MKTFIHIGVYGVIRKDGCVLLVKKSRGPYKGLFDLPGGRIEKGETPQQALTREVQEETGIVLRKWTFYDELHHRRVYEKDGEPLDFHHQGSIYMIDQYDDSEADYCRTFEDVNGSMWVPVADHELFTPFAKIICESL